MALVSLASRYIQSKYELTEGVEDASKLDSDVTSSNDDDALGQLLEVEEAVTVETELGTFNLLRLGGSSSNGNDNAVGRVLALDVGSTVNLGLGVGGLDGEGVGIDERSVSGDVLDLVLLDICTPSLISLGHVGLRADTATLTSLVDAVQSLNVLVSLALESRPVNLGLILGDLVAVGVGLVQLLPVVGCDASGRAARGCATTNT